MKKFFLFLAIVLTATALVYGQGFGFDGFGDGGFPGGGFPGGGIPGAAAPNKARDKANDLQDTMGGRIPLRFFNALNRAPVPGATIQIPNVGNFTTNQEGKITFPKIPDGNYTLVFSKEGFITTDVDFQVQLGNVVHNWFNVSPGISASSYRIVLEWGEKPADLDLHFEKTGGSGTYHISYLEMKRADDGNAILDRDDTTGYGPETITIGRIEPNAMYTCWVHDYTNRNDTNSNQLAQNGAIVRIYSNNRLLNTFSIPAGAKGTRWNVFKIERGNLTSVNTVVARQ